MKFLDRFEHRIPNSKNEADGATAGCERSLKIFERHFVLALWFLLQNNRYDEKPLRHSLFVQIRLR